MEVLTESVLPREKTVLLHGRTDEMTSREVPEQTRALFLHHSLQDVPPGCQSQCNSYQFLQFQLSSKWHHSSDYFHSVHLHTFSAANTKSEPRSQQDQGAGQGSPPSRRMSMHLPPALRSACVWHKTKAVITIDHKTRCHFTPFNVFKFSLVISAGQGLRVAPLRAAGGQSLVFAPHRQALGGQHGLQPLPAPRWPQDVRRVRVQKPQRNLHG